MTPTNPSEINVKDIRVDRIDSKSAVAFVKRHHYSGKVTQNSQLHFGAFHGGRLHGVLSFGPPMDKSKVLHLVEGTEWSGMVELNRMAFDNYLPRNSESRVLSVCMRLLRKHCPHVRWVLSFADGAQCGDGTIYRASGFLLTQINPNRSLLRLPGGETIAQLSITSNDVGSTTTEVAQLARKYKIPQTGGASVAAWLKAGAAFIPGFQLRYIYLLDKTARLTVPVLPFSVIDERGAGMYKGQPLTVGERKYTYTTKPAPEAQTDERPTTSGEAGGSIPTPALQASPPDEVQ